MPRYIAYGLCFLIIALVANATPSTNPLRVGSQGVNLWNLEKARSSSKTLLSKKASGSGFSVQHSAGYNRKAEAATDFRARWFEQPLDHFSKKNKHTFHQRYWVNDRHYSAGTGGPVIVLDGGETSGEVRNINLLLE